MDQDCGEIRSRDLLAYALPLVPLGIAVALLQFLNRTAQGEVFRFGWNWVPSLDVNFSFQLDGLSLLFALLISGIGSLIFAYAPAYLGKHRDRWKLFAWLMLFMISMLGLVLADNVITLFLFWELTSITSYLLIGFQHEREQARAAALQALLVTGLGGLSLLAGLLLLGEAGGSYEISVLLTRAELLQNSPLLVPMVLLILLGAFTKSAQFPFHFWLPNAMEAPTPVSAYLHSATMVKAGVYLVARFSPAFSGAPIWDNSILIVGAITALTGGWLALTQVDLKRILAYSTISALGTLMLLLGIGTPAATKAAVVLLLSHALYKAAFFLIAGTVDHCVGTRDIRRLGGLVRVMPWLAAAATLAALSKAGVPPAGGFLAKELIYESTLKLSPWLSPVLLAVFLVNVSFVAVAVLLTIVPFFGTTTPKAQAAHHPGWRLVLPPLLLGGLGIVIGLFPGVVGQVLVAPAVAAVSPGAEGVYLKLWYGFNLPLFLSLLTLAAGVGLFAMRHRVRRLGIRFPAFRSLGPASAYEFALRALKATAAWQTQVLQNGRLRIYLLVVLLFFVGVVGFELVNHIEIPRGSAWLDIQLYELFIPALIISAAVMAVRSTSRLAAVCALGVIGYAVAMLFVMFGAPDLAMTQLAIETLTVILFVFVIYRLPRFSTLSSRAARVRDAIVSAFAGVMMTAIVLAATAAHAPSRLSPYFTENSLTAAKGKNMVNVILVDFRGIDTLGEITVLAVAALGIYALMRLRIESPAAWRSRETMGAELAIAEVPTSEGPASSNLAATGANECLP